MIYVSMLSHMQKHGIMHMHPAKAEEYIRDNTGAMPAAASLSNGTENPMAQLNGRHTCSRSEEDPICITGIGNPRISHPV